MRFFDRFKKGYKEAERPPRKTAPVKQTVEKREKTVREEIAEHAVAKPAATKVAAKSEIAHRILLKPIISEKTTLLHGHNQYVFKVASDANKIMIKRAIKEAFHADPSHVRIIRVQGKEVRRGNIKGRRASYKKAIVSMPAGVTLPVYEGV